MREIHKSRKLVWIIGVLLGICLCVGEAWAQGDQMDAVRKRMEDGLAQFVGGDPAGAAKIFEDGYKEYPYSAFLFNAGVCYEKLQRHQDALAKYQQYMQVDPEAPDIDEVRRRVARLESILNTGGTGAPAPPPPPGDLGSENMRSLVVVESEPAGAPVRVYRPASESAPAFELGKENPQWTEIVTTQSPTSLSLGVGLYHIVVDKFEEYNPSDTKLRVSPGHVHHFKANLSQGVFMSFLRISSNVKGAHIWLDDTQQEKPEWGTTPYGELVAAGAHEVLVEAPGFQPLRTQVELQSGERKEIEVKLARVNYGFLRVDADLFVDREQGLGYEKEVPNVYVSIDGKQMGYWRKGQKPVDVKASSGPHQVVISAEGYKDYEGQINVPKGQVLPIHVSMIPKYPRGGAWTQAVLAAGFLGAGIYLGVESDNIKDQLEAERQRGALQSDDSRITKGRWFAVGADVGFAAGAVLGGLATWNFLKDPLPESSYKADDPVEFPDPLKKLPTSQNERSPSDARRALLLRGLQGPRPLPSFKPAEPATVDLSVTPTISGDAASLFIGGRF